MRKLLISTKDITPSELKKYEIKKEDIISGKIEQLLITGRLILVDVISLDIVIVQTLMLYMAKYRYKGYCLNELSNNFFVKLIPEGLMNFICNIEEIEDTVIDLSRYRLVVHIGDIHGCFDVLMEAWKKHYADDNFYIFLGDFIDRGKKSAEVIKFILSIYQLPNTLFIEGNHDTNLWHWATNSPEHYKKSFNCTRLQIEEKGISKEEVKRLCQSFHECATYKHNDRLILVSHGGLLDYPQKRYIIDASDYINSQCHDYTDLDTIFSNNVNSKDIFQVHGHSNFLNKKSNNSQHSINLEGGVEFGGNLRIATLSQNGFRFYYYKNTDSVMQNFFNTGNYVIRSN